MKTKARELCFSELLCTQPWPVGVYDVFGRESQARGRRSPEGEEGAEEAVEEGASQETPES